MITYEYLESRLLGAALKRPEILSTLSPTDFMSEQSRMLWSAFRDARNKYQTLDPVLLANYLHEEFHQDLSTLISEYLDLAPENRDLDEHYAKTLIDMSRKARLDREVSKLAELELPVDEKIASLQSLMQSVQPRVIKPVKTMKAMVREVVGQIEERFQNGDITGVATGFPKLDQVIGGLQQQDLYVVAARPSIGKTAFAVNIALHVSNTAFVSAEQPTNQIIQRMIAIDSGLAVHKMRNPRKFGDHEWARITSGVRNVSELDTQMFDEPAPTVEEIHVWATKAVERGAKLVIVDYLQRIRAADRKLSAYERVSHVAMSLKELARNLNVPVLSLAQINREGAKNARMEHLKGSGDIEQEADVIMMLDRDIENLPSNGYLSMEKNRHGPLVSIPLYFETQTMKFGEAVNDEDDEI
ncbi:MAG: DnaB-like helicase C-terminal domain-containing protein [Candidatus Thiodiazotropha endolucinida]|nr:AAA family ATPase [Candidatus Thiodiazotropha taylori]MCG7890606.1 AAA family ATPase [Candidatus Thiodiazotropha taylori]MCW4248969.1 AAA family ATPase [Candidatus Thiodiazotropha endolucinida]MCW4271267.1 AAA family ATPase [Candidatus Thiodiazotropha endolucinida]